MNTFFLDNLDIYSTVRGKFIPYLLLSILGSVALIITFLYVKSGKSLLSVGKLNFGQYDPTLSTTFNSTLNLEVNVLAYNAHNNQSVFGGDLLKPYVTEPKRIKVEELGIDIDLIVVGVDEEGKLENPKDWNKGGWYRNSARPGENGNIIINAHYDDNRGRPAAFWELKNIKSNDKVYLYDELGRKYTYLVSETFYVDIQDPNRLKIFDKIEDVSELTLITCGGVWLPGEGTYNKRLVVKAELDKDTPVSKEVSN